jgi:hypothetical protein
MTEYLVVARAAIIPWTNLAVMPAENPHEPLLTVKPLETNHRDRCGSKFVPQGQNKGQSK